MQKKTIPLANKLGLHARAAAKLTQCAAGFQCAVWISRVSGLVASTSSFGRRARSPLAPSFIFFFPAAVSGRNASSRGAQVSRSSAMA